MIDYVIIAIQLAILAGCIALFVKTRALQQSNECKQTLSDLTELSEILNELVGELRELTETADAQLAERTSQASALVQALEEKIDAAKQTLGGRLDSTQFGSEPKESQSADAHSRSKARNLSVLRSFSNDTRQDSLELARTSRIGRGEVELMLNLERYQRKEANRG